MPYRFIKIDDVDELKEIYSRNPECMYVVHHGTDSIVCTLKVTWFGNYVFRGVLEEHRDFSLSFEKADKVMCMRKL